MARHDRSVDIHNYEHLLSKAEAQVRQSRSSERNKALILQYRDVCMVRNICRNVRLIRVLGVLTLFARTAEKDFDHLSRADIEGLFTKLVQRRPAYTPETLGSYKGILKRFLTWVVQPDDFPTKTPPPLVSWISAHVKKSQRRRLDRNELLTPQDIKATIAACQNVRDRALISVLWETGGRIAEIGNLQLKHVIKREHGFTLDVDGKTGQRNPLIISSAPALAQWLALHPAKDDPQSPLWVHYHHERRAGHLRYSTIRGLIQVHFQHAGITKRVFPHLFRHSRSTHVLASGLMTGQLAKSYFGWTQDSDMLARYSHLIDQDANDAILRENNMATQQKPTHELQAKACPTCNEINAADATYCTRCTAILDLKMAHEAHEQQEQTKTVLLQLAQLLAEKGLLDEAATAVHNAGLGKALKALASAPTSDKHHP